MIPLIEGADMLYHEATFMNEDEIKATETKHSTAEHAASIASKASVKKLLLGHFSARYKDLNPLLEEAKNIFKDSYLATEGLTFTIPE
jgi:ribonuclease Z